MNKLCWKCTSTGVLWPEITFVRGANLFRVLVNRPSCIGHTTPILESVVSQHELHVFEGHIPSNHASFLRAYGVLPDCKRTRVDWHPARHERVAPWLQRIAEYKESKKTVESKADVDGVVHVESLPTHEFNRIFGTEDWQNQ